MCNRLIVFSMTDKIANSTQQKKKTDKVVDNHKLIKIYYNMLYKDDNKQVA